jgi:hypothetical protein
MMPGFSVRRSLLLRNGIQEYLLARDVGEATARARPVTGGASGAASGRAWFRRSR